MRLLLDTSVLLWWLEGSVKLGSTAHDAIEDPRSTVWVSAVTAWEIVIKTALGRLTMREPLDLALPRALERSRFQGLSITMDHALAVRSLPHHHRDPFDRMLVAQARSERLTVVTSDSIFERYGIATLDARR
jgi:PIN domain nuclease of toxin-antitoxin system